MSADDQTVFALDCLEAHNLYREMHDCPPLLLNQKMSDQARTWAQHLLSINDMVHSTDKKYGENIYMAENLYVTGDMPVKDWYDEIVLYPFEEPIYKPEIGHFTQVIWKGSKELGVGVARKGYLTYVVTIYSPPGNFIGRFREHVPLKIRDIAPIPTKQGFEFLNISAATLISLNASKLPVPHELTSATAAVGLATPNTTKTPIPNKNLAKSDAKSTFHAECLKAHNTYRALHGVPPLRLSDMLTKYATNWAQKIADSNKLRHSPSKEYGENIYKSEGVHFTGASAVKMWYEAADDYNFDEGLFTPETGGFTQVVWKDSKLLGVGVAQKDRVSVVVASYYPPGNIKGHFKDNVFPKN